MVAGNYTVILPKVDDDKKDLAKEQLADLFSIMKSMARKIIDSAPVILLSNATEQEVNVVKSRFNGVSGIGMQLDIRPERVKGVVEVKWPKRPQIAPPDELAPLELEPTDPAPVAAPSSFDVPKETAAPQAKKDLADEYTEALTDENDIYTYSVFLSNIGSPARKEKAIESLMGIRSISHKDAEELCNRTVIPVVKGVSKAEAEVTLKQFVKLRIFGCITKRPK